MQVYTHLTAASLSGTLGVLFNEMAIPSCIQRSKAAHIGEVVTTDEEIDISADTNPLITSYKLSQIQMVIALLVRGFKDNIRTEVKRWEKNVEEQVKRAKY